VAAAAAAAAAAADPAVAPAGFSLLHFVLLLRR